MPLFFYASKPCDYDHDDSQECNSNRQPANPPVPYFAMHLSWVHTYALLRTPHASRVQWLHVCQAAKHAVQRLCLLCPCAACHAASLTSHEPPACTCLAVNPLQRASISFPARCSALPKPDTLHRHSTPPSAPDDSSHCRDTADPQTDSVGLQHGGHVPHTVSHPRYSASASSIFDQCSLGPVNGWC